MVAAAAATESAVLIVGEPGTGKSLLASRLHELSPRSVGPFVRANRDNEDSFGLADRGTLHVDEIGDLSAEGQARLLRLIQARDTVEASAGSGACHDVRVVATTYRDLAALVDQRAFRADLLYRINVLRIDVPPLRHRRDDIPLLARHFAERFAERLHRPVPELPSLTLARLTTHSWPGNVRELRNLIERAMTMDPDHGLKQLGSTVTATRVASDASEPRLRDALAQLERHLIVDALRRTGGVRREAARLLGIDPRNLAYFLRKHGLGDRLPGPAPRGRHRSPRPASGGSSGRSGAGAARRSR